MMMKLRFRAKTPLYNIYSEYLEHIPTYSLSLTHSLARSHSLCL
jgi:hypothetical protein